MIFDLKKRLKEEDLWKTRVWFLFRYFTLQYLQLHNIKILKGHDMNFLMGERGKIKNIWKKNKNGLYSGNIV